MDLEYINNQGDLKEIHLGGLTDAEELLIRSVIEALIAANLVTANSYTDDEITSAFSSGATGSFTAGSGEEITVTNGLITAITAP